MEEPRSTLRKKARLWDQSGRVSRPQRADLETFTTAVDALISLGDLRYHQYAPHSNREESFATIFSSWVENVRDEQLQKQLVRLARSILFVDLDHLKALYREAFFSVIFPKMVDVAGLSISQALGSSSDQRMREALNSITFATITTSGNFDLFRSVNGLRGFQRAVVLGTAPRVARTIVRNEQQFLTGRRFVILEDFVGSGGQAKRVLEVVRDEIAGRAEFLFFIPILAFESSLTVLRSLTGVEVWPVSTVSTLRCLKEFQQTSEPELHRHFRHVVNVTAQRVLKAANAEDEKPTGPYGYRGSGGLVVTAHNTPNNTLPLIHHDGLTWRALFRRLHYAGNRKGFKDARS